jgi:polyisoprenoid-binding protein YceI
MRITMLVLLALTPAVFAQQARPINGAQSKVTVTAYKSGLFSFAGHDHTVSASISSGTIDETARTIHFTIKTADMQVLDPGESQKNRDEIRQTMLSDKLLDAGKFPTITFHSTSVQPASTTSFTVKGELSLHGVVRPVSLTVSKNGRQFAGETKLKQTDFGLTPVSVAGGTIKVKDEVKIEFLIVQE